MRSAFFIIWIFGALQLCAQEDQNASIKAVIDQLFDGMRSSDSTLVKPLFLKDATLSSIVVNKENRVTKQSSPASRLVSAIGLPKDQVWNEMIWSYDIKVDGPLAAAWTDYTFYIDDELSHCGVNVFELIHLADGWKISAITDTRRKTNCQTKENSDIHDLMEMWHHAAAVADEDVFFGSMTQDAIYLGTDASERWLRDDMREWSKEYFDRESAWSFTTVERNIELDPSRSVAWFDELLDTWMGPCRGSGVAVKTDDGWKISHYHLSIAVPNEHVTGYLELVGLPPKK